MKATTMDSTPIEDDWRLFTLHNEIVFPLPWPWRWIVPKRYLRRQVVLNFRARGDGQVEFYGARIDLLPLPQKRTEN